MQLKPRHEAIKLDVQHKAQETQELYKFVMIFHIPMRYELFMKAKNNELFILDKLTKYIETINNDLRP